MPHSDLNNYSALLGIVSATSSKTPFSNFLAQHGESPKWKDNSENLLHIENMLILGHREDAIEFAVQKKQWPLAMLVSSTCSAQIYQSVVQRYLESNIPQRTPLHMLSLIYSNQTSALKSVISASGSENVDVNGNHSFSSSQWRRSLCAFLSNKGSDWESVGRLLGDKVWSEERDVMAAHIFYICSKCLPSSSFAKPPNANADTKRPNADSKQKPVVNPPKARYTLLGTPIQERTSSGVIDLRILSSLRMTEVLEWTMDLGAKSEEANAGSIIGKGLSGLFGFGSTASKDVDTKKESEEKIIHHHVNADQVLLAKATLGPIKLRFSYLLADLGYTSLALSYALAVREVASILELASTKSGNKSEVRPFKKKMVQDLDDFISRLQIHEGKLKPSIHGNTSSTTKNPTDQNNQTQRTNNTSNPRPHDTGPSIVPYPPPQVTQASNQGNWALGTIVGNVLTSSTLKELVDGSSDHVATTVSSLGSTGAPVNQNVPFPSAYPPAVPLSSQPPIPGYIQQNSTKPAQTTSTSTMSQQHPFQSFSAIPPSAPGMVSRTSNNSMSSAAFSRTSSTDQAPAAPPTIGSGFMQPNLDKQPIPGATMPPNPPGGSQMNGKTQYQVFQPNLTQLSDKGPVTPFNPTPQKAPTTGHDGSVHMNETPPTQKNQVGPSSSEKSAGKSAPDQPSAGSGFMGYLKKSIISFVSPNAHIADDNVGGKLEAYYDEKLKRWIFPGEVNFLIRIIV